MYKLPGQEELLFYMLYTTAAVLSLIASCCLLFRRANAIAPDITSPVRLRRWTAALFASMTLSHVAYLPGVFLTSDDDILLCDGSTTRCRNGGVHCQPKRYLSANNTYLYPIVGHRLNNIYGTRG